MKNCFLFLTLLICLRTTAQTYVAPDIKARMATQKTMAILPGIAPVSPTHRQLKRLAPEHAIKMQDSSSLALQLMVYHWFITQAHGNTLEIQDPGVTDSLLEAAGLSVKDVIYGGNNNIGRILGVDVLMSASMRPDGQGYLDPATPSYTVSTVLFLSIRMTDAQNGDPLWEYEGDRDGGHPIALLREKWVAKLLDIAYEKYPYVR